MSADGIIGAANPDWPAAICLSTPSAEEQVINKSNGPHSKTMAIHRSLVCTTGDASATGGGCCTRPESPGGSLPETKIAKDPWSLDTTPASFPRDWIFGFTGVGLQQQKLRVAAACFPLVVWRLPPFSH
jgi:hypothetical protein